MTLDSHDPRTRTVPPRIEHVRCPTAAVIHDGGRGEYRCGCCFRTFAAPGGTR